MEGGGVPGDAGSVQDSTVPTGHDGATGDGASSSHDSGMPPVTVVGSPAGEAGAAQFCDQLCAGLVTCAANNPDAGPCHCDPGSSAIERADYVQALGKCVKTAITTDCSDAGAAVEGCQLKAAAAITPSTAAATFCKDLEFTLCSQILPDCLTNAGIYADPTIAAFSSCFSDLPDANVDGGCVPFGTCVATAAAQ
jgi:hypothetical protein